MAALSRALLLQFIGLADVRSMTLPAGILPCHHGSARFFPETGRVAAGSIEAARAAVYDAREAVAPGIDLLRWRGNGPKFSDFSLHRTPVRLEIGKPCARSAAMRAPITQVRQTPSACPKTGGKIPASGDAVPPCQGMPHTQPCLTGGSAGYRREPVFNRQLPGEKPG
jgi:hypothetical protein